MRLSFTINDWTLAVVKDVKSVLVAYRLRQDLFWLCNPQETTIRRILAGNLLSWISKFWRIARSKLKLAQLCLRLLDSPAASCKVIVSVHSILIVLFISNTGATFRNNGYRPTCQLYSGSSNTVHLTQRGLWETRSPGSQFFYCLT